MECLFSTAVRTHGLNPPPPPPGRDVGAAEKGGRPENSEVRAVAAEFSTPARRAGEGGAAVAVHRASCPDHACLIPLPIRASGNARNDRGVARPMAHVGSADYFEELLLRYCTPYVCKQQLSHI
jgi:hypothetical protein